MKRSTGIALVVIASFGIVAFIISSAGAYSVRVNTRDLPEYGLVIIDPVDPGFTTELSKMGVPVDGSQQRLKPFSFILQNGGPRELIAYRVRWDVSRVDGTVATHLRTYAEPGVLMGMDHPPTNTLGDAQGLSIKPGASRYVSLVGQTQMPAIDMSTSTSASADNLGQIQRMGAQRDTDALFGALSEEISSASNVSVTLDAAVFDDGTLVGPDSFNYFGQLNAEIQAKDDLLQEALYAAQANKPLDPLFKKLEVIATDQAKGNAPTGATSPASDYYNFYKREFAKELLEIRRQMKDDKRAVWFATRPLYRKRPALAKF